MIDVWYEVQRTIYCSKHFNQNIVLLRRVSKSRFYCISIYIFCVITIIVHMKMLKQVWCLIDNLVWLIYWKLIHESRNAKTWMTLKCDVGKGNNQKIFFWSAFLVRFVDVKTKGLVYVSRWPDIWLYHLHLIILRMICLIWIK